MKATFWTRLVWCPTCEAPRQVERELVEVLRKDQRPGEGFTVAVRENCVGCNAVLA